MENNAGVAPDSIAQSSNAGRRAPLGERLRRHVPPWKKKLLAGSLILGMAGGVAQITAGIRDRVTPPPAPMAAPPNMSAHSGKADDAANPVRAQPPSKADDSEAEHSSEETLVDRAAPVATKLGISFAAGLFIGLAFRMFLKTMALITAAIASLYLGLSYFNLAGFDATAIQLHSDTFVVWATDQMMRMKDVVLSALPSSTAATMGFISGFKKR